MYINLPGILTFITIQGCLGWPHGPIPAPVDKQLPGTDTLGGRRVKGNQHRTSGTFNTFLTESYLRYAVNKPTSVAAEASTGQNMAAAAAVQSNTPTDYFRSMNQEGKYLKNVRKKIAIETGSRNSRASSSGATAERSYRPGDAGIQFARLEQIKDSNLRSNASNTVYEMVLTVGTAVAALFAMGVLAALFGCCCRKRRQTDVNDNGESKERQKSASELQLNGDGTANHSEVSKDEDLETPVSVKDKIKALEVQQKTPLLQPSPDLTSHSRKKLENEAFKAFENTGILIGMGRTPQITVTDQENSGSLDNIPDIEDDVEESVSDRPGDTKEPNTLTNDTTSVHSIHSSTSQPFNPDVVIADVDIDEFADIQRETEVLKSFRRVKPPRNRSPATRNSHRKLRQKSQANLSKTEETVAEKRKSTAEISPEDKENISVIQVSSVSNSDKDSVPKQTPSPAPRQPSPAKKPPSPAPKNKSHIPKPSSLTKKGLRTDPGATKRHSGYTENVSNIFYLIDPTVKNKCHSMGDVTATKLNTKQPTTKTPEENEDPDLVKALNQQIKASKKDKQETETKEEDLPSPIKRERTQSDPSKKRKSKVMEQTAL